MSMMNECAKFHGDIPGGHNPASAIELLKTVNFVHNFIKTQLRWHINFSFEFFFMQFSQKMHLYFFYAMVQKSQKMTKNSNQGGPAFKKKKKKRGEGESDALQMFFLPSL